MLWRIEVKNKGERRRKKGREGERKREREGRRE
jgi:hypothetical protein